MSREAKPTAGPWVARDDLAVWQEGGGAIAQFFWVSGAITEDQAAANARLAAAAPDLLVAAKTVLAGLNARIDGADPSAVPVFWGIADLNAAISRAEGR